MKANEKKDSVNTQKKSTGLTLLLPVIIIALVSFAVYFNALSCGFVYDDRDQIVNNQWIRDAKYIPDILSQSVWGFSTDVEEQGTANYYRPLMHLVYMACYYIFGMKAWGFHLVNILFHTGTSVLVFFIISRLLAVLPAAEEKGSGPVTGQNALGRGKSFYCSPSGTDYSLLAAFLAALLFAVHPIHTEAVTWVASLPEVAFTFFGLLSFYLYMRGAEGMKGGYVLSLTAFAFSVFFKEPALTLPAILIAYDLVFRKTKISLSPLLRTYMPYVLIACIYLLLRLNALKGMVPTETLSLSPWQAVINIFPLFTEYLQDLFFPFDLKFWHEFNPIERLLGARGLLSFSAAIAFVAALFVFYRKNRTIFLGLVFILIPLLPAFYIKGIGSKPYAERYLYMPSVGFVIVLAVLLLWLFRKWPRYCLAATAAAFVLAGVYSAETIVTNPVWKDDFTFYEHTIKKAPEAVPLRIAYGVVLSDSGRIDEAIEQYQTAIKLGPNYWQAYANLAVAYGKKGLYDKAIEQFEIVKRFTPNSAINHSNIGLAYMSKGELDKAIEELLAAVKLNPDFASAHYNLGTAYEKKGLLDNAIEEYRTVLRLTPGFEQAHYFLGRLYMKSGRLDEAITQMNALISLRAGNASYHNTLGALYAQKGLLNEAVRQFEEAVRLAPDKPSYRQNLERAAGQKGSALEGK